MKAELGEREYQIRFANIEGDSAGLCDPPEVKKPEIVIHDDLDEYEELETLIHEALHALQFLLFSEKWVRRAAKQLATLLWRQGWRKKRTRKKSPKQ